MSRSILFTLICLGLVFASLGSATQAQAGCSGSSAQPGEIKEAEFAKSLKCLINKERTSRGIKALDTSSKLTRAAKKHSVYMTRHNCFDHQCSGEGDLTQRLKAVDWLTGGLSSWTYGENIAWGSGSYGTPRSLAKAWMNSSGHRANILNSTFREQGMGVDFHNGKAYATQDFGFKIG